MKRISASLAALGFAIIFGSCTHLAEEPVPWNNQSRIISSESPVCLAAVARDPNAGHTERGRAVFKLFANHLHPGQSAEEVHRILGGTSWLKESKLYCNNIGSGFRPIRGDSLFCLGLLTDELGQSDWWIEFSLSGTSADGSPRREDEAVAFLQGQADLQGEPKLQEFGLHFFGGNPRQWLRTERFSQRGMHVYGQ